LSYANSNIPKHERKESIVNIQNDKLVDMLKTMVRIRRFEERVSKEFAAGKIPGFTHLYIGEEAVATGACATLRVDDYIVSTHRGHGHLIAKGGKLDRMMAELYGKKTGYNKGKGGSMHIADVNIGMLGAIAIVGGGITIATGAGLSAQMRDTDQVSICFFGDGASNRGTFHEAINLASVWKLPVVYVIENNLYAESTHQRNVMNITNIADRAIAYGIPGIICDGNDVIAVYEAVGEAVARARKGEGPSLIECKTYRHQGHSEGDVGPRQIYRTQDEIDEWKKKDPIARLRKQLIETGVLTNETADKIDQGILEEVEKAAKFAEESPFPEPEEALEDVYS
jgi:pyruvate dehydrogenase E1 component alpha subunit